MFWNPIIGVSTDGGGGERRSADGGERRSSDMTCFPVDSSSDSDIGKKDSVQPERSLTRKEAYAARRKKMKRDNFHLASHWSRFVDDEWCMMDNVIYGKKEGFLTSSTKPGEQLGWSLKDFISDGENDVNDDDAKKRDDQCGTYAYKKRAISQMFSGEALNLQHAGHRQLIPIKCDGVNFIDIRTFIEVSRYGTSGLIPSREGITLNMCEWKSLLKHTQSITEEMESLLYAFQKERGYVKMGATQAVPNLNVRLPHIYKEIGDDVRERDREDTFKQEVDAILKEVENMDLLFNTVQQLRSYHHNRWYKDIIACELASVVSPMMYTQQGGKPAASKMPESIELRNRGVSKLYSGGGDDMGNIGIRCVSVRGRRYLDIRRYIETGAGFGFYKGSQGLLLSYDEWTRLWTCADVVTILQDKLSDTVSESEIVLGYTPLCDSTFDEEHAYECKTRWVGASMKEYM